MANKDQYIISKDNSYSVPSTLNQLLPTLVDLNIDYSRSDANIQNYQILVLYGFDAINNMILNVLYTQIGERDFEPTFGSRALNLLHEPNDNVVFGQIEVELYDRIRYWLGGLLDILLSGIIVTQYPDQQLIEIAFIYKERVSGVQNSFSVYLSNRGRLFRGGINQLSNR